MKKLTVLAIVATVLMAGPVLAVQRHLVVEPNATFAAGSPSTTNNSDSCDIGTTPAATLLLPYFDVDITSPRGTTNRSTLFTVTNTSRFPQIAHVTVWTDWSYPVLDFNLFLTGYDVASIDLYDVIARGNIGNGRLFNSGQTAPTTNPTGSNPAIPNTTANPFFAPAIGCGTLPGNLPTSLVTDVQTALTTGFYPTGTCTAHTFNAATDPAPSYTIVSPPAGSPIAPVVGLIGGVHATNHAVGYVTIDVANNCSTTLPTTASYYSGEILYDNVLIGDYEQISPDPTSQIGGGAPMVHIRAIPEGGPAGGVGVATNLPFTFYDRYTSQAGGGINRRQDRRVPLPNTFAARWIQGGTGGFNTNYQIWREGVTNNSLACNLYAANSALLVTAIIRFDEHEVATSASGSNVCSPCLPGQVTLPETSSTATSAGVYPAIAGTDVGGWMYLNLNNNSTTLAPIAPSATPAPTQPAPLPYSTLGVNQARVLTSQNWVTINMRANYPGSTSGLSALFDAAWLGNGCTPGVGATPNVVIAPASQRTTGNLICPTGAGAPCPAGANTQPPTSNGVIP